MFLIGLLRVWFKNNDCCYIVIRNRGYVAILVQDVPVSWGNSKQLSFAPLFSRSVLHLRKEGAHNPKVAEGEDDVRRVSDEKYY